MKIPLRKYWELLHLYLRPQWPKVLLLAVLLTATIGIRILNPQIIRRFIDSATQGEPLHNLINAALIFLGCALLIQFMSVISTYLGEDIGWIATNNLRADLALHALKLDMSYHNEHTPGEMIERIDGDTADLAIFFAQFVIRIAANLVLLAGILVALFVEDWRVGLALALYAVGSLWALNRLRTYAVPFWKAARDADSDAFGYIEEQLAGTEDLRSSGAVGYTLRNLLKVNRRRIETRRNAGITDSYLVQLWIVLYETGRIIALVSCFFLFSRNLITLGTVYLIITYTDAIFQPLRQITNEIQNLQKAGGSIERVQELYSVISKVPDTGTQTLPEGALSVSFENVNFRYNAEDTILHDLDFNLRPGSVLGLLGRTGSGKTTIARLLFRLYDVSGGCLNLNGINIHDIPIRELQRHVGMVTQDVQLFRATVRNNLTFFNAQIDDARIMTVLEDLELMDWFRALPKGLDSELESGGKGLSAGEAQLLAFTRVFLKNPGLVILDEASSRLDPLTEARIERAIDKLLANRTGIIIAHRLATVRRADHILILERGAIGEYGPYTALVNDPESRFSSLLRTGLEGLLV